MKLSSQEKVVQSVFDCRLAGCGRQNHPYTAAGGLIDYTESWFAGLS